MHARMVAGKGEQSSPPSRPLRRRSGCFPAEPYPPLSPPAIVSGAASQAAWAAVDAHGLLLAQSLGFAEGMCADRTVLGMSRLDMQQTAIKINSKTTVGLLAGVDFFACIATPIGQGWK